jgi:putative Holliday junction resolvase
MVVDSISDFFVSNIYAKKFLGIDYGLKHIGVAVSDPSNIISVPYSTFTEEEILTKICQIIKDENIYGIIIGKPYHLDGSVSEMIQNVEKFSQKLEKIISEPILFIDERLSSKGYKSGKKTFKDSIHQKSACLILDDFLTLYKNSTSGK